MSKDAYWFKHDSNASHDPNIEYMRSVWGWEGYGWYWAIIETMRDLDGHRFPWKRLAVLTQRLGEKAEEFIGACIDEYDLFDSDEEFFWSESLLRRMDYHSAKQVAGKKGGSSKQTPSKPEANAKQELNNGDKSREEKIRVEKKTHRNESLSGKPDDIPYREIVEYLNEKSGKAYKATTPKTKRMIHARWAEGYREEDFRTVIELKCAEWKGDDMAKYLRPETLFGTKFEGYLNAKPKDGHADFYTTCEHGHRHLKALGYCPECHEKEVG